MSRGITTRIRHLGKRVTFRALCQQYGLSYYAVWRRYSNGERGLQLVRPVDTRFAHRGNWNAPVFTNPHPNARTPRSFVTPAPTVTT